MWAMTAQTATASLMSPIGVIRLCTEGDELVSVRIDPDGAEAHPVPATPLLAEATRQLKAYFAQERRAFDLPLRPLPSQRGEALRKGIESVPYGETLTYGKLAAQVGSAPRAVGQACKRNPFPILIPCHRVTSTTGPEYYSGGAGAATKAWLIEFEKGQTPWKRTLLL
jgi:methylated-DNA-[protein]-cysteine S-methyltransferase